MTLTPIVIWNNELILTIRASIKHSNNIIIFKIIFLVQLVNTEQEEGRVCNFTPSLPINLSQIENQQERPKRKQQISKNWQYQIENQQGKIHQIYDDDRDDKNLHFFLQDGDVEFFCVIHISILLMTVVIFCVIKHFCLKNEEGDDFLCNSPPLSTQSIPFQLSLSFNDPIPSGAPQNHHLHHITISNIGNLSQPRYQQPINVCLFLL